jgi:diacylglycerol kinase (ATP)
MPQLPWVVLVNPTAGGRRGARRGHQTVAALRGRGDPVRVVLGTSAAEAEKRAADAVASGARGLVVVGGDGAAHIGLNVAARADVPLGLVAAGSGNDFARALGVARLGVGQAVAAITASEAAGGRMISLGQLDNGRFFGTVMATGFDAAVNARASRMRGPGGRVRYPAAMLAELGAFRPMERTVTVDGVAYEHRAMLVVVGNGPFYGGGMRICPAAELTADVLHVTVVEEMSVAELLWLFPRVYRGTHIAHPKATVYVGQSVAITVADGHGKTPVIADGETVRAGSISAQVAPDALQVLAPTLP